MLRVLKPFIAVNIKVIHTDVPNNQMWAGSGVTTPTGNYLEPSEH